MALPMTGYSPQQQQFFQPFQVGSQGMQPLKKRSGIGKFFLGEQEQFQRTPTQTPEAMNALQQLLQRSSQTFQNPYEGFAPIEQRAKNRFQSESIPGIAERFTSMGGSDTRGSSDFAGQLGGAQSDFDLGLEGLRTQYGLQNQQNALQQLQLGLTPQFDTIHQEAQPGFLQNALQSLLSNGMVGLSSSFGNQAGTYLGNKSFGKQGQSGLGDIASLITKLLPLL